MSYFLYTADIFYYSGTTDLVPNYSPYTGLGRITKAMKSIILLPPYILGL